MKKLKIALNEQSYEAPVMDVFEMSHEACVLTGSPVALTGAGLHFGASDGQW